MHRVAPRWASPPNFAPLPRGRTTPRVLGAIIPSLPNLVLATKWSAIWPFFERHRWLATCDFQPQEGEHLRRENRIFEENRRPSLGFKRVLCCTVPTDFRAALAHAVLLIMELLWLVHAASNVPVAGLLRRGLAWSN